MNASCPGLYCGRLEVQTGVFGSCGPCPGGFKVNEQDECVRCIGDPTNYDLLYLGFMILLPLTMHYFYINNSCENFNEQLVVLTSAVLEALCSAIVSVLLMDPLGSFHVHTCKVKRLSDWYTLFYNPYPYYNSKLHCTQEAVYPLQTMVLVFYLICPIQMMIMRFFLKIIFGISKKKAVYSALYFFPFLMFLHSIGCGLIYYGFPIMSIFISMIINAWHQSSKFSHRNLALLNSKESVLITGGNFFFLAYGIVSMELNFVFLICVPLPFLFYGLTLPFTDPNEFLEN